jgi:hypothetical protein
LFGGCFFFGVFVVVLWVLLLEVPVPLRAYFFGFGFWGVLVFVVFLWISTSFFNFRKVGGVPAAERKRVIICG